MSEFLCTKSLKLCLVQPLVGRAGAEQLRVGADGGDAAIFQDDDAIRDL